MSAARRIGLAMSGNLLMRLSHHMCHGETSVSGLFLACVLFVDHQKE